MFFSVETITSFGDNTMASLQLFVLLAVMVAAVAAQSYSPPSYAAPAYKAPEYKDDYKPSYSKGRVKIQVTAQALLP